MALQAVGVGVAVAGLGYGVAEGQDQQRRNDIALGRQRYAQQQAQARASAESNRAAEDVARARRRVPNLGELLNDQQIAQLAGPGSTFLTGRSPAAKLGNPTMLGG